MKGRPEPEKREKKYTLVMDLLLHQQSTHCGLNVPHCLIRGGVAIAIQHPRAKGWVPDTEGGTNHPLARIANPRTTRDSGDISLEAGSENGRVRGRSRISDCFAERGVYE
jgi:hypothetical protein